MDVGAYFARNRHTCACRLRYDKLRNEIEGQNFNTSMGGKAGNSNRKLLLSTVQPFIYKCPRFKVKRCGWFLIYRCVLQL